MEDLRGYHLKRARSERELAYESGDERVSDAHMGLSMLHLQHLHRLDGELAQQMPAWSSRLGAEELEGG
jgi:hypothetical protein